MEGRDWGERKPNRPCHARRFRGLETELKPARALKKLEQFLLIRSPQMTKNT